MHISHPSSLVHIDSDTYGASLLKREMDSWANVRHVGTASTAQSGLDLLLHLRPDVAVVDLFFSDMDGFNLIECITRLHANTRVIVFTWLVNDYNLYRLRLVNIAGCVVKSAKAIEDLNVAVDHAIAGRRYIAADVADAVRKLRSSPDAFFKILSTREQAIMALLGSGLNDCAISERIGITAGTVHCHRHKIMKKLGLQSRADLMRWCQRSGFVLYPERRHEHSVIQVSTVVPSGSRSNNGGL